LVQAGASTHDTLLLGPPFTSSTRLFAGQLPTTYAPLPSPSLAADHFTTLGSTQNRTTTYQPYQTLHSPPTPPALTTSHLIASGAHLGHSSSLTHRASFPTIYGTRTGISYIDLRQTLPALRRAAEVVRGVVERDGIVVFVGSLKGAEKAVWENAKRLGENGYGVTKWLPGTISNAKEVFGWCEIPQGEVEEGRRAPQKATPMSFKPSLLVLLSPTLNQHALREATGNEVPTIGICDTDIDPRSVTYAIPANDDSPRTVELIAGVLGMAGKDGLARKKER
jgi:small subunit ribosomal protein S2